MDCRGPEASGQRERIETPQEAMEGVHDQSGVSSFTSNSVSHGESECLYKYFR